MDLNLHHPKDDAFRRSASRVVVRAEQAEAARDARRAQGLAAQDVRGRLRRDGLAEGVRRPGAPARWSRRSSPRRWRWPTCPARSTSLGLGIVGPTLIAHGTEAQKQRYIKSHPDRRRDLVSAVLGAGCGLRPRGLEDQGRARQRRLRGQRAEGLDQSGADRRLRHPAGPHGHRLSRSTRASRTSSWTCTAQASRCGRSSRSPATRVLPRSSSTNVTRTGREPHRRAEGRAGSWPRRRSASSAAAACWRV